MIFPVAGFDANPPVKTPVFSTSAPRSRSLLSLDFALYSSTAARIPGSVSADTSGCSGESTMYVAPKIVSGRVVKTLISSPLPGSGNAISAPSDRPIQFFCCSSVDEGQSRSAESSSSLSAYAVILIIHCRIGRRSTVYPFSVHSETSSLASTVPSASHQLTGISAT